MCSVNIAKLVFWSFAQTSIRFRRTTLTDQTANVCQHIHNVHTAQIYMCVFNVCARKHSSDECFPVTEVNAPSAFQLTDSFNWPRLQAAEWSNVNTHFAHSMQTGSVCAAEKNSTYMKVTVLTDCYSPNPWTSNTALINMFYRISQSSFLAWIPTRVLYILYLLIPDSDLILILT